MTAGICRNASASRSPAAPLACTEPQSAARGASADVSMMIKRPARVYSRQSSVTWRAARVATTSVGRSARRRGVSSHFFARPPPPAPIACSIRPSTNFTYCKRASPPMVYDASSSKCAVKTSSPVCRCVQRVSQRTGTPPAMRTRRLIVR